LASRVVVLSERPGRVVADVPVPFGYPREPGLRYRAEFAEKVGEVVRNLGTDSTAAFTPTPALPLRGGGRARRLALTGPPLAVLALVLAAWYLVSEVVLSPERRFLLPPPHAVVAVGF